MFSHIHCHTQRTVQIYIKSINRKTVNGQLFRTIFEQEAQLPQRNSVSAGSTQPSIHLG